VRRVAGSRPQARQRGAALLALLAMVSVMLIFAYVAGLNRSSVDMAQARARQTSTALAQAKEALIAYAVTYNDTHDSPPNYTVPGYLPCPDLGPGSNVEGTAAPNCGAFLVSAMGKLPWKTLGLDRLIDGSGECLWYAVSGTYKNSPNGVTSNNTTSNNLMNWDKNGLFKVVDSNNNTLAGASADTQAVAVIFAPGGPLAGQNRATGTGTSNCGGNYNAAAYLDSAVVGGATVNNSTVSAVASAVSTYHAGTPTASFNDELTYITRADIWNAVKKRSDFNNKLRALTRRVAECTAMYGTKNAAGVGDKRLPWGSSLAMALLSYYDVDRRYRDVSGTHSGRLSYRVSVSKTATSNALATNTDLGYAGVLLPTPYSVLDGSYCAYQPDEKIWYDNWKDQLFYVLASNYSPSAAQPTAACLASNCLTINGGATRYAAFVIFAGERLAGQNRNTLADKSLIGNYLEGRNASNHPNSSGNGNYEGGGVSAGFNDIVYAIDTNLAVKCYDTVSGTMQSAPSAACP
jgi:type II secretory pathway pseudopilin PulG